MLPAVFETTPEFSGQIAVRNKHYPWTVFRDLSEENGKPVRSFIDHGLE